MISSIFLIASVALAQFSVQAPELGDVALAQALLDLGNPYRLMCVAAHPDDEDGATLAYYRMKYGTETMAVIATRGEGGQNEIGPELYEELAVIRTKEMQAAAKIEGAHLRFLDLPEFGFSKSIEETQEVWGKEETLRRMVREIRAFRPHVIITNHGRMKDHGHHQAIGAAVQKAFDVAADEARFPEAGDAWQVARLYIRNWEGGEGSVAVSISELEPHRGKTYAEIAASALMEHKSQGMQQFIDRLLYERPTIFYDLVRERDLPKGINETRDFGPLLQGIQTDHAGRVLPEEIVRERLTEHLFMMMLDIGGASRNAIDEIQERLWKVAAVASEIRLAARALDPIAVPGQAVPVEVLFEDFNVKDISPYKAVLGDEKVTFDETGKARFTFKVPKDAPLTLPAARHIFGPLLPQESLRIDVPTIFKGTGAHFHTHFDLDIAAPVELVFEGSPYLLHSTRAGAEVRLSIINRRPEPYTAGVTWVVPEGWTVEPASFEIAFAKEDEERRLSAVVRAPESKSQSGDWRSEKFAIQAVVDGLEPVEASVRVVDVAVPEGVRVGVIQSYDDTFVKTLQRLDVAHEVLEPRDLSVERLAGFTSVIVDIRAYRYRPGLAENNAALLEYVKRGGSLLVMYHKTFDWDPSYAPYPITLSTNRVTREDAPVEVLAPEHPLFNTPNKIGSADWEGWLQERGLYFPSEWDAAYTPLVSMADPGETIPPGSILIARYGEGTYLYTALGWYRQLRELHPGALRMFANMISLRN